MALAVTGAAFAATLSVAPVAHARASSCSGGTAQVYRDGYVRVYRQGAVRTFACVFSTGRRWRVFDNARGFRRAGRYLAYFTQQPRNVNTNPQQCAPNKRGTYTLCITLTESKNLTTGAVVWGAAFAAEGQAPPAVRRLAPRSSDGKYGAVIGTGADTRVIRVRGLGGYDQLDGGAAIVPASLRASATRLRWRSGASARSAALGRRDTTPAPRARSCIDRGATPEYVDAEIRVNFSNRTYRTQVCRFRTGRRFTLLPGAHGYQRAGNYLLYRSSNDRHYCYSAQQVTLESKSLIDGVVVAEDAVRAASDDCPRLQTVLRGGDGAFAYIADPLGGQPKRVVAARRTGNALLDSSPNVEFGSLLLSGDTLSWRDGGVAATARL